MRFIIFLLGISLSLSVSGQKGKKFSASWRQDPAEELKIADSDYQSYKKDMVLYYISNDNENLYLDVKIKETIEQNRILKKGMNVWITMDGKSQKKTGVRYPIGSEYSGGRKKDMATPINPPTPLSQAHTIQLMGFQYVQPSRFPSDNKDNFRGKVWYNKEGDLLYTLVIPFKRLSFLRDSTQKQGDITIGIEYGVPPPMPEGVRPTGSPSAEFTASRGGGGGRGGSRGGGGSGGGAKSQYGSEGYPVMIWVKNITLAKNN
jgi:uncharacterized membrane protein YgcG